METLNRIIINLTDNGLSILEETRIATGRENKIEVIRDALAMWHMLRKKYAEEKQIFIGTCKEDVEPIFIPPLQIVKHR